MNEYILTISCPDKVGIVAAVSIFLSEQRCNIFDSAQFGDRETQLFFMRVHFFAEPDAPAAKVIRQRFDAVAKAYAMEWEMAAAHEPSRLLILVSQHGHCLNDLLYRYRTGSLKADIACIVSNHQDFRPLAEWHGVPFHYLPVTRENKQQQEHALREIIASEQIELVVLARYMQILSPELCTDLKGRCINIHHSFLPSFIGAQPYKQAYARGVKLIGATAHYVTPHLDEGPIIEQGVERVDHAHTPEALTAIGRDIESMVLSRAIQYHVERRVFLNGNKTVILR
ncbi:formyltetrahydrofolate deformylase [Desulfovibrio cuneatus]|uniref:formyltetrahydrofolate deformylase n=1 Tax=Desulfovibrio cuneatus TaxID=159728 RepID=UPI000411F9B1|nr:formyltetrahydrofolate deformylase [Desulfovibrio cuneatus]